MSRNQDQIRIHCTYSILRHFGSFWLVQKSTAFRQENQLGEEPPVHSGVLLPLRRRAGEAVRNGQRVISSYLPDIDVGAVDCFEYKDPDNLILPASNCYCPIYFIFPSKRKYLA